MDANQAVHTYLTTAPESQFAGSPVDIIDHWQGAENLLWRVENAGRQAVIKLFIDAGQVRSRRQFEAQQLFYPAGFATRPLWYDWQPEGVSRPVLVYDWVDGDELDVADRATLLETARILATVHSAGVDEVSRLSPNPISLEYYWRLLQTSITSIERWLGRGSSPALHASFSLLAQAVSTLVAQALPVFGTAPPTAVHGDPKLENFIQSGGSLTLFDWERFGLGDPALEAATFLFQHQTALEPSVGEDWLTTYLAHTTTLDIQQRIRIYRRLLPFQSACFLLDGLRELAASPDAMAQNHDELSFLQATLVASLTQAANDLQVNDSDLDAAVSGLFERLAM